jgi:hypothetical protein
MEIFFHIESTHFLCFIDPSKVVSFASWVGLFTNGMATTRLGPPYLIIKFLKYY